MAPRPRDAHVANFYTRIVYLESLREAEIFPLLFESRDGNFWKLIAKRSIL